MRRVSHECVSYTPQLDLREFCILRRELLSELWPSVGSKIKILPRTLNSIAAKGLPRCRPFQLGA